MAAIRRAARPRRRRAGRQSTPGPRPAGWCRRQRGRQALQGGAEWRKVAAVMANLTPEHARRVIPSARWSRFARRRWSLVYCTTKTKPSGRTRYRSDGHLADQKLIKTLPHQVPVASEPETSF